ncbi:MAG: hypothetical protein RLY16_1278 [Bacteroidota bacterium]
MKWNLFGRKVQVTQPLFHDHFVDPKAMYVQLFDAIPCVSFIGEMEGGEAFAFIKHNYSGEIIAVYQHNYFDHAEQKLLFNNTLFVLRNKRLIDLNSNYCQVLFGPNQYGWSNNLIQSLAAFRKLPEGVRTPIMGFARTNIDN